MLSGLGGVMSVATALSGTSAATASPLFHVRGDATTSPTGLSPTTINQLYQFNLLSCSSGLTCGSGQTIAIVDAFDDPTAESDLATFSTQFGLPACTTANGCFTKATPQGLPRADQGWALEISLDIQWAHAIAPGAKILLVEAATNSFTNLFGAIDYAATQSGVHQLSMSWGGGEFSSEASSDSHFQVSGVSFFASSGDGGHGVIYPSSSPNVIGVGGTTLNFNRDKTFTGETAWPGSGGGISAYESEPSYQVTYGGTSTGTLLTTTGGNRGAPDVSYDADPKSGVSVYDSYGYHGQHGWFQVGGTSAGSPQWAALFAIVNSGRSTPISSTSFGTGSIVYNSATGSAYASNFRDITAGTNGNCGTDCSASSGYDFVTGVGSPLANNLVPYLQSH